jgi:nucleoside phosphorylase
VEKLLTYAEDVRLNYDPENPAKRFLTSLPTAIQASTSLRLPKSIPWPDALKPTPRPLTPAPAEGDDLSRFNGYDAVVVTYTSAEAAALAALFTPGYPLSSWYQYRHNIADYIPIVTGRQAPFNSTDPRDARYFHSLGLYFPCTIGTTRILLVKSGLHLDYDLEVVAPVIPVNKMLTEMIQTVNPKLFITTGTGGGIGGDVRLGDVIIAGQTLFDCSHQFANEPWAHTPYTTTAVSQKALSLITPDLLEVNAAMIATATPIPGRAEPRIWSGRNTTIVTTDVFAFDTSSNAPFQLHGLGQACDMGDAMVGQVMRPFDNIPWYAIRNASDPQIPDPAGVTYKDADKEAGDIYKNYGVFTTAASVIATWAIIAGTINNLATDAVVA